MSAGTPPPLGTYCAPSDPLAGFAAGGKSRGGEGRTRGEEEGYGGEKENGEGRGKGGSWG